MPYTVTIATGKIDVMLPNGMRAQAGDVSFLSDEQYSRLSPTGIATLFSAVTQVTTSPTLSVHSQNPTVTYNPNLEGDNEPSTTTTPLDSLSAG